MEFFLTDFISYLLSEKGLSSHTIEAYKRDIYHFKLLLQRQNINNWNQVTQQHIINFIALKKEQLYASASLARALIALKVFFRFLKKEDYIEHNIAQLLDTPKVWQLIPTILSPQEMLHLLAQPDVNTLQGARDRAIFELLYACGLRVSELCHLKIADVDDCYVRVKGKGSKERIVPLGSQALNAIDHYLTLRDQNSCKRSEYLFLSKKGGLLHRITVWKLIKHYAIKADIEKCIFPHTFRHSFATHLLNNGADLRLIQEMLGHANISSTDLYTHVATNELNAAFHACHPRR